jgi:hypothetical protein
MKLKYRKPKVIRLSRDKILEILKKDFLMYATLAEQQGVLGAGTLVIRWV